MAMRILILGSTGMFGQTLLKQLNRNRSLEILTASRGADNPNYLISDFSSIKKIVQDLEFDYVVNCIGILASNSSASPETLEQDMIAINGELPVNISNWLIEANPQSRFIHISSNGVFHDDLSIKTELSLPNSNSLYGKSKILGEFTRENSLIVRASILGTGPKSLYQKMRKAPADTIFVGYPNCTWNGISDISLAKYICGYMGSGDISTGIRHAIPRDGVSKLDLLHFLLDKVNRNDLLANVKIDETVGNSCLQTIYSNWNSLMWEKAGYVEIPKVLDSLSEL